MKGTIVRILIVAVLAVVVHGGASWMRAGLKPARVAPPDRDYHSMPLQYQNWVGQEIDLQAINARRYDKIGAHDVVERKYRSPNGQEIAFHCAVFTEYDVGAFHLPTNCYRSQGWRREEDERAELDSAQGTKAVSLSTWTREGGSPDVVCYWYELDEHIILSRWDLGRVRLKLRDREVWPPLIKVLITTSAIDPRQTSEELKEQVQGFAQWVHDWIHQPLSSAGGTPLAE